jgi:hypothetical protein
VIDLCAEGGRLRSRVRHFPFQRQAPCRRTFAHMLVIGVYSGSERAIAGLSRVGACNETERKLRGTCMSTLSTNGSARHKIPVEHMCKSLFSSFRTKTFNGRKRRIYGLLKASPPVPFNVDNTCIYSLHHRSTDRIWFARHTSLRAKAIKSVTWHCENNLVRSTSPTVGDI